MPIDLFRSGTGVDLALAAKKGKTTPRSIGGIRACVRFPGTDPQGKARINMIRSAQLFRSILVALALVAVAPLAIPGVPLAGIAQAQTVTTVAENTAVGSVAFQGHRRFTTAQLNSMVDLATRRAYTQAGIAGDIETIRAAYDQAGYFNVSVTTRAETMSDGRLRVVFVVNEGDRAGVAAINFTGNNSIGASALKNTLVTKESHFLSWLTRDDLYDEDRLAVDRELIRLYYANRGFPDARVLS